MCGIVGVFDVRGKREISRGLVERMNETQHHRGPDEGGIHLEPGLGLGHRRLSIIDLATGQQPLYNEDGTVCVVFNGEIYNYQELIPELTPLGHIFHTRSDTEVIVHAWEAWGAECVKRFRGMFAFALWDRNRETVFLARDRLGVKPLYYAALNDGTLIFGSELKALTAHAGLDRELDPFAVEEYFALGYIPEPRTIYRGALEAPAGAHPDRRARPTAPGSGGVLGRPLHGGRPHGRGGGVRGARPPAARIGRAPADRGGATRRVPLGRRRLERGRRDDGRALKGTGRNLLDRVRGSRVRRVEVRAGGRRPLPHAPSRRPGRERRLRLDRYLAATYDEPFADSSAIPTYRVCQLARTHVTVALSGDGGDESFAGYRRYRMHVAEDLMRSALPLSVRLPVFGLLGRVYPKADWAPRVFRAKSTFQALARDSVEGYFHGVSILRDDMRAALFSNGLTAKLGGYNAVEVFRRHAARANRDDPSRWCSTWISRPISSVTSTRRSTAPAWRTHSRFASR